jgi:hypothetical protein
MPILVEYVQSGVTQDQYDRLKALTDWESRPPKGAIFHVAGFQDGAIHVIDVWESRSDLDAYVASRLAPSAREIGLHVDPPTVMDTHMVAAYAAVDLYRLKASA